MARIEGYVWISCRDERTCPECRNLDGREWKRKKDAVPRPPHPDCTSPAGCRCDLTGICDDEGAITLE